MRQLKHHEKKLLKKVDFLRWKSEDNIRELQVRRPTLRRSGRQWTASGRRRRVRRRLRRVGGEGASRPQLDPHGARGPPARRR